MISAIHHVRRRFFALLTVALLLGLPFVRIKGESALRFDVASLKLYFFGSVIWISEAYFFLLVFILFFLAITLVTVIYGRIWCGWTCPQTVLSRVAGTVEKTAAWFIHHRVPRMLVSQFILLVVSMLVSADLIWFFVSPYDVFVDAVSGSVGAWTLSSWVVLSTMMYLDLAFVRQKFCVSVCPYARFQKAVPDDQKTEADSKGTRRRVLRLSALFALIAVMFAYQVFVRMPVDLWVTRDETQEYHQVGLQGTLMNAYSVVVENRSLDPASYRLSVSGVKDAELVLSQNPFVLPGNSLVRLKVFVIAKRQNLVERVTRLHFTLENTESTEMRIVQEAPFVYPERSEKGVEI